MPITTNIPDLTEFLKNESHYLNLLENKELWRKIPYLNYTPLHELKDLTLVRFRGMIQDMLDPEIYLQNYQVNSTDGKSRFQNGKYRDCLVLNANEKPDFECFDNVQAERRTVFVVSLPGFNSWASTFEESNCTKRDISNNEVNRSQSVPKRPLADETDSEMIDLDQTNNISNISNKRQCTEVNGSSSSNTRTSALSAEYLLNSPIPDRPSKACLIKLYSDFDSHTLNSIIDVVGFLSVDPALDASTTDPAFDEFESCGERQAQNPPPSLIPRLHAVAVRKLEHNNPLLDSSICESIFSSYNFEHVYKDLKILLTQCLLGDDLAAEYLLLHLISTVYIRSDLHSLGKFALNLCNIPEQLLPSYTQDLYDILELFLPASHYLPMTLDTMNTLQFFPKKDYQTNKLTSGILQLAPHTHLVLDETRLQPGKLENNGVRGVQNLAHFIKTQQLKCDFQYYDINFNTDIPVLVLSEGRSMLPNDFQVPLNADNDRITLIEETLKAAKHYAQPKLDAIRCYLTSAKLTKFDMNPEESEMIQTDFVEMRKANAKVGADELHGLLVLSRLLAIASGKSKFDRDSWEKAKQMEATRRSRMDQIPKSKRNN
ncbi:mini-chromosome maintenance complex-binding protein [Episyrphus balteatus]|uniref:mini-chromosome maintenance complex-binding protein n=1 Tax=Episyrphus balteatus TaxID=286459 RepID=UPI0024867A20|nr:mini-chromosome maintenance complex-binding protein [Episyrphus balteatus]